MALLQLAEENVSVSSEERLLATLFKCDADALAHLPEDSRLLIHEEMSKGLQALYHHERRVIGLMHGIGGGSCYSFREVASLLNTAQMNIYEIERDAMLALKKSINLAAIREEFKRAVELSSAQSF